MNHTVEPDGGMLLSRVCEVGGGVWGGGGRTMTSFKLLKGRPWILFRIGVISVGLCGLTMTSAEGFKDPMP